MRRIVQLLLVFVFISGAVSAQKTFTQTGDASYYSDELAGRYTASGEKYDTLAYTAAHMTLPFGTHARITNMKNGKSVVVKINDRGPFVSGRVIDLSKAAAKEIDLLREGTTRVKIEVVDRSEAVGTSSKPVKEKIPATRTSSGTPEPKDKPDTPEKTTSGDLISGLLKVNPVSENIEGYGVQIGSYSKINNVFDIITENDHPCYVQISQEAGEEPMFRVIVGDFPARNQAETLRNNLKATYPGCFIVNLRDAIGATDD